MASSGNYRLSNEALNIPVLICSYKRPKQLKTLLDLLVSIGIRRVYFFSDGGKIEFEDLPKVQECRVIFAEFSKHFDEADAFHSPLNLGCRKAIPAALDWFFERHSFGAVLEEDCVPDPFFFEYLAKSQETFVNSSDVFCISGTRNHGGPDTGNCKSIFPLIWGWATWADRWKKYKLDFRDSQTVTHWALERISMGVDSDLFGKLKLKVMNLNWNQILRQAGNGSVDTWDYSLIATLWREQSYCVLPEKNLIVNVGFGPDATHTRSSRPKWVSVAASAPFSLDFSQSEYSTNQAKLDLWMNDVVYRSTFIGLIRRSLSKVKKYWISRL